jgi:16S rRNA (uracil1498-N3)-methyltransferase
MARRRFFVPEVRGGRAELNGDEARHLTQVLRVQAGQQYEISDNQKIYLAQVDLARKQHVVFRVIEQLPDPEPPPLITLLVALIKFERLELLLEKATELGVGKVQLVKSERSEKGLDLASAKRMPRWQRIVQEASQQARRSSLPELSAPITFKDALSYNVDRKLFLDEVPGGVPILEGLATLERQHSIALLIGPEGGWPEHERQGAREYAWQAVTLGPLVLRTETAAIAALATLNATLQTKWRA